MARRVGKSAFGDSTVGIIHYLTELRRSGFEGLAEMPSQSEKSSSAEKWLDRRECQGWVRAGSDYTASSGTLSFGSGAATATLRHH